MNKLRNMQAPKMGKLIVFYFVTHLFSFKVQKNAQILRFFTQKVWSMLRRLETTKIV